MKNLTQNHSLLMRICLFILALSANMSTYANNISIIEAAEICRNLKNLEITTEYYDVIGVVHGTSRSHTETNFLNIDLWEGDRMLFVYHLANQDSLPFEHRYDVFRGDTIVIRTRLENYKGTPAAYNGYLLNIHKYVNPTNELIKANKDKEWQLHIQEERNRADRQLFWWVTCLAALFILAMVGWEISVWYKSRYDALTHLLNRQNGARAMAAMLRFNKIGFLCILNIDNFKRINDSYGHLSGDECIILFAEAIRQHFVGCITSRIDGDEFAVYVKGEDPQELRILFEDFFEKVQEIKINANPKDHISVSVGVSFFEGEGTADQLYQLADRALYESKQHKGCWLSFVSKNRYCQ